MKAPISILNAPRHARIDSVAARPQLVQNAHSAPSDDQINRFVSSFVGWVEARPSGQSEQEAIDLFLDHYRQSVRDAASRKLSA